MSRVAIGLSIGVVLGALAGYFGGVMENVIMRFTDILQAIPGILMAIVIVAVIGQSTFNLMLAIGITSVPQFVRITRASVLTVKNEQYVEAARSIGLSSAKIIFRHILPYCLSPLIVLSTLRVASAIIAASGLSFLGLGVPAPNPEWGGLLSAGRKYIRNYSYMTFFPGLANHDHGIGAEPYGGRFERRVGPQAQESPVRKGSADRRRDNGGECGGA